MKARAKLRLLCFLLVLLMLTGCGKQEQGYQGPGITEPELLAVTEPPTEPPVQLTMPEYELTYSGSLKDLIVTKELPGEAGLEFLVKLSSGEEHIFTLHYNSDQGDLVTFFKDKSGAEVPVAFTMAVIPEQLSEEDEKTFCIAQEAVNEIVSSLIIK